MAHILKTMRKPHGYSSFTPFDEGPVLEWDTVRCIHCQRHGRVAVGTRPEDVWSRCPSCNEISCPSCIVKAQANGACVHWEKALEIQEKQDRQSRLVGIG